MEAEPVIFLLSVKLVLMHVVLQISIEDNIGAIRVNQEVAIDNTDGTVTLHDCVVCQMRRQCHSKPYFPTAKQVVSTDAQGNFR